MWLINTKTLQLEEFVDSSTVKYAILSHTWGDEEVTFNDMRHLKRAKKKKGFKKIAKTCELAFHRDLEYAWVDTCCIDKTSSAELSEAINAMFSWYRNSTVCFVFLEDFEPLPKRHHRPSGIFRPSSSAFQLSDEDSLWSGMRPPHDLQGLKFCKWFTRGWTLQELIAPQTVEFYDFSWRFRFTKESRARMLSKISRIDIEILTMKKSLADTLVAVKMAWAAYRQTKRPEDIAYCLLGIFDINMPMLYGEGQKAFQRLQEAIINQTNDPSILAWLAVNGDQRYRGVLARSPLEFAHCSEGWSAYKTEPKPRIDLNNRGVKITGNQNYVEGSDFMGLPLALSHDCPKCRVVHSVSLRLLPTVGGLVRASPEACCRKVLKVRDWADAEAYRQVSKERSDYLENQDTRPILLRYHIPRYLFPNVETWSRPNSAWSNFYYGFVGETFSKNSVITMGVRIPNLYHLELLIFVFNVEGEDPDVEIHFYEARSVPGWEGDNGEDINGFTGILDDASLDAVLEQYKKEKQSGRYRPQTTVSLRRRGSPFRVAFGVRTEGRNVFLFHIQLPSSSSTAESSRSLEDMGEDSAEDEESIGGESIGAIYFDSWMTRLDDADSYSGVGHVTRVGSRLRSNSAPGHDVPPTRHPSSDPGHGPEEGQTSLMAKRPRSASI